jgi:small-conductance mechanosensitive channel
VKSFLAIALAALLLLIHSFAYAQQPDAIETSAPPDSAPVVVDGVELFKVAGSASLSAEDRAEIVGARIVDVARDHSIPPRDLTLSTRDGRYTILARAVPLVSVTRSDVELEHVSARDIAEVRLHWIRQAIERYRLERRPDQLARSLGKVIVATVVAALTLAAVLQLFRWMLRAVERRYRARIQSVSIRSFEIVGAERIWRSINSVLRAARSLVVVALAMIYVAYVLYQFPATRPASDEMFTLVAEPFQAMGLAVLKYVPNLVFLIILIYVARALLKLNAAFFESVRTGTTVIPRFERDWARPTSNLVRVIVILFAAVVAYPYLPGSGTAAFQGISIFAGVLFSLGASTYMANIIAGYTLTYRRAFRVGEFIRIGEHVGEVIEVRLLVTHLKTPKNEELIVPNSLVLQTQVLNYSRLATNEGLVLHTMVGIGYEVGWRKVEAMLLEAANRTSGLLRKPSPYVLIRGLDDFAVKYELNVYVDTGMQMLLRYAALHRSILDVFNENGVQIMTPAYEGDPEQPKIAPPAHLSSPPGVRGITGPDP